MAQQTVESEEKHGNNAPKINHEEQEAKSGTVIKITSDDVPKRMTRSRRPTKPKKEFDSSPSSKKQAKEEKPMLDGLTDNSIKKRVLWGCSDKSLFFDALLEHGKDFDTIQNFMSQKQKKRGDAECNFKSKDQIRHFYYRTWHKISPFIHQSSSDEIKKQTTELQGVLCYGEIRKKVVAKFDEKLGHKLNELVHKGSAVLKLKGKKLVLRAPTCKVKKLQHADASFPMKVLQKKMSIELIPRNNKSWSFVQSLAQNPRVSVLTRPTHSISNIINFLQQKWSQERLDGEIKTKLKVHLPPNIRFNHQNMTTNSSDNSLEIKNKTKQEINSSDNKVDSSKFMETTLSEPSNLNSGDKQKLMLQQSDSNEDDDDDNDDVIHMDVDDDAEGDKKSTHPCDKDRRDDDKEKNCELDDLTKKLINEGLDEVSGGHVTIAKLLVLLGCPEVIRLEYDWKEPTFQNSSHNNDEESCPMKSVETCQQSTDISTLPKSLLPPASPYLNSRIMRLLEIACTEYCATSEQKIKDSKPKEPKSLPNVNEVFRVPDSVPPRAVQASRNAEKRIMDQDLLQQMPIFQKKPDMFLSRRSRKKTVQKPPPVPIVQRLLVPKIGNSTGNQEVLIRTNSSLIGFSNFNDLIRLHSTSSSLLPSSLPSTAMTSVTPTSTSSSSLSSSSTILLSSSSKPSLITMEPSELKPSVRRIIPITLNKMNNASPKPPHQPSAMSKVITGTDVFLVDKIFEDSASNDISANQKTVNGTGPHSNDIIKSNGSTVLQKQASIDENWLHSEELSLSFLQDGSSIIPNTSSGMSLIQHFMSESSRDSKFDVDFQCFINDSSQDYAYASKFADIAAQLSTSSSSPGLFQTPSSSSSPHTVSAITLTTQAGFVPSKLTT